MSRFHLSAVRLISYSIISISVSGASFAADESKEPTLNYSVKIGQKTISVSENEPIRLEGVFNNPQMTITPESFRVFPYQGLSFRYPRSFTFEADINDPNTKSWILSGNDLKIMYFVINAPITTADFADSMISQFGHENSKVTNPEAKISLGEEKLTGTSIKITVATHQMVMDIYSIPTRDSKTKLLVFQDNLDDSGLRSKEGEQALKDIKASFLIKNMEQ